jgi:hypothetical protein
MMVQLTAASEFRDNLSVPLSSKAKGTGRVLLTASSAHRARKDTGANR